MSSSIRELWLEYRVAKQFVKTWDKVEENIDLVKDLEKQGQLPNDDNSVTITIAESARPAHWLSYIEPPTWFIRYELGEGSELNYWDTQDTLVSANKKRAKAYDEMLRRLALARKVLRVKRWA